MANRPQEKLSVIIPLAKGETAWKTLYRQSLVDLPAATEVIFVIPSNCSFDFPDWKLTDLHHLDVSVVKSKASRAIQMNAGARQAKGNWLWFLHADSAFTKDTLPRLEICMKLFPRSLLYFDLTFQGGDSPLIKLNTKGVWLRSHLFQLPFGDQGFCLQKQTFWDLGGYQEGLRYGEDHALVWSLLRSSYKLQCTDAKLLTSPRKYNDNGWLPTTSKHLVLTYWQAAQELLKTSKFKITKNIL